MIDRAFRNCLAVIVAAGLLLVLGETVAKAVPPNDPSYVTRYAQAAVLRSASDCRSYTAATTVNVWANAPAEVLTAEIAPQVRYVRISNEISSATPFATDYGALRVGPSTNTPPLSLTTGDRLKSGGFLQYQVTAAAQLSTTGLPIWLLPQSTGTYCVTYYW